MVNTIYADNVRKLPKFMKRCLELAFAKVPIQLTAKVI